MTEATRAATVIIPRVDETAVREADHRARMSLYLGVASLLVLPLALPAFGLWWSAKDAASVGGSDTARVGRNFALLALVLWLVVPVVALSVGLGSLVAGAAAVKDNAGQATKISEARQVAQEQLGKAAGEYAADASHCPKSGVLDPWGNSYSVVCGPTGVVVVSNGPDGVRYSGDDIKVGE